MTHTLKPYAGNHAGTLHHVVERESGNILRNATPLEVEQFAELTNLRGEARHLREALQHIARIVGVEGGDCNDVIKRVKDYVGVSVTDKPNKEPAIIGSTEKLQRW